MAHPIVAEPDDDDLDGPAAPPAAAAPPMPAPPAPPAPAAPAVPEGEPPSREELLEQIARLSAAQAKNNSELTRRRHVERTMKQYGIEDFPAWLQERGIDPATGQRVDSAQTPTEPATPAVDESEVERRVQLRIEQSTAQHAERSEALETALRETAIRGALREAGFSGTMESPGEGQLSGLERALRVMDLEKITVGPDGKVAGVAEAVKALQGEIPEWFRRNQPAPPPARRGPIDGGDRRAAPQRPRTWEEQAASRLSGGR